VTILGASSFDNEVLALLLSIEVILAAGAASSIH